MRSFNNKGILIENVRFATLSTLFAVFPNAFIKFQTLFFYLLKVSTEYCSDDIAVTLNKKNTEIMKLNKSI